MSNDKTICALIADVKTATEHLKAAKDEADRARRNETAAINALNQAQRGLDAALAEMRKQAPRDSDWWYREHT